MHAYFEEIAIRVALHCSAGNGFYFVVFHTLRNPMGSAMLAITEFPDVFMLFQHCICFSLSSDQIISFIYLR